VQPKVKTLPTHVSVDSLPNKNIGVFVALILALALASVLAWTGTAIWLEQEQDLAPQGWFFALWLLMLVVITLRYLMMLGLATMDFFLHQINPSASIADDDLPFVSVVMPVFNEGVVIGSALKSLISQNYPRFEILVVDDGSHDESFTHAVRLAARASKGAVRVLSKVNGGKSDALNHGMAHAYGEIVVCVDGDSSLDVNALRFLVPHFADPTVGAVAGKVRVANQNSLWSAMQALEYVQGYGLLKRAQNAAHVVTVVPGPLGAFRKSALAQIGGYKHDTFAEDYDVTVSLLGAGWHVVYEPNALVFTEAPESLYDLIKQRYRWTRGSIQVARKRNYALFSTRGRPLSTLGVWYLWVDNLVWPIVNVGSLSAFVFAGLYWGLQDIMVFWWAQVLILDVAIAAFCVAIESERLRLVVWAIPNRFLYQTVMDVIRLMATIEEFLGFKMDWGQIKRMGKI
jgi:poly-beta-1,6-N-acetyl-D-glucosamine synthase